MEETNQPGQAEKARDVILSAILTDQSPMQKEGIEKEKDNDESNTTNTDKRQKLTATQLLSKDCVTRDAVLVQQKAAQCRTKEGTAQIEIDEDDGEEDKKEEEDVPAPVVLSRGQPQLSPVGAFAVPGLSAQDTSFTETMAEASNSDDIIDIEALSRNNSNNHGHVVHDRDVVDVLPKATAIENAGCDPALRPVPAKSMEHMIVWSRKKMAALLLLVVIAIVLGIVLPLTQKNKQDRSQQQPEGTLRICSIIILSLQIL